MKNWRSWLLFAVLLNIACSADAGIIRHVVRPIAKKTASVSKTVAQKAVHASKTVLY